MTERRAEGGSARHGEAEGRRRREPAATSSAALRARGLRFSYGERPVVDDVSLELARGELVAVVGPNGAGKSTLLRLLLGLLPADAGEVELGGRPLASLSRREIARTAAFVPQSVPIDFPFTVREVVAMGRTPHLGRFEPERARDRRAVEEALRATDAWEMRERPIDRLSGGERQRVLLARAFAQQTELLLLDEPSASLDLLHAYRLLSLVRARVASGGAALVALHDLGLAARFCDRIVAMRDGAVRAQGPPAEVLTERLMADVFGVRARLLRDAGDVFVAVKGPTTDAD